MDRMVGGLGYLRRCVPFEIVMEPSYLFLLSNQDLISSYLIVHLIFHLISDLILSRLMMPSLLWTHGLHMYLI